MFLFVWGKKREWLSRSSVIQPTNKGGLGVVDFWCKLVWLKVMWVKRFLFFPGDRWHLFFRHYLRRAFLAEPVNRVFALSNTANQAFVACRLSIGKLSQLGSSLVAVCLTAFGRYLMRTYLLYRSSKLPPN